MACHLLRGMSQQFFVWFAELLSVHSLPAVPAQAGCYHSGTSSSVFASQRGRQITNESSQEFQMGDVTTGLCNKSQKDGCSLFQSWTGSPSLKALRSPVSIHWKERGTLSSSWPRLEEANLNTYHRLLSRSSWFLLVYSSCGAAGKGWLY